MRSPLGPGHHKRVSKRPHQPHRPPSVLEGRGPCRNLAKNATETPRHRSLQKKASKGPPTNTPPGHPLWTTLGHEETSQASSSRPNKPLILHVGPVLRRLRRCEALPNFFVPQCICTKNPFLALFTTVLSIFYSVNRVEKESEALEALEAVF